MIGGVGTGGAGVGGCSRSRGVPQPRSQGLSSYRLGRAIPKTVEFVGGVKRNRNVSTEEGINYVGKFIS